VCLDLVHNRRWVYFDHWLSYDWFYLWKEKALQNQRSHHLLDSVTFRRLISFTEKSAFWSRIEDESTVTFNSSQKSKVNDPISIDSLLITATIAWEKVQELILHLSEWLNLMQDGSQTNSRVMALSFLEDSCDCFFFSQQYGILFHSMEINNILINECYDPYFMRDSCSHSQQQCRSVTRWIALPLWIDIGETPSYSSVFQDYQLDFLNARTKRSILSSMETKAEPRPRFN